jgi:hypothetical protein
MSKKRFVVVTTDNTRRGVFGGYLKSYDPDKMIAILTDAHMAVYWSAASKGVLGLASIGPQKGSRITPAIPAIELNGVTAVMDCKEEAVKQWQSGIWD